MNQGSTIPDPLTEQIDSSVAAKEDLLWTHLKSVPAFRALLRAVEARFYRHITLPEPVLDLGCGDGNFADLTFDQNLKAGVDPWWGPLRKAAKSDSYDVTVQGLGGRLPFADGYFASAVSNSVLEHIEDIQPVLNETSRVLKDGGLFVVTMPSHLFSQKLRGAQILEKLRLYSLADGYRSLFNRISRHAHVDTPETWSIRFAAAGFIVERWQYYFSEKALHALEIGHLQGLPSAALHALTGSWILAPWESNLKYTERWVRPFYDEVPPQPGTMMLFVLRKVVQRPATPTLPRPDPIPLEEEHLVTFPISHLTTDAEEEQLGSEPSARVSSAASDLEEPSLEQVDETPEQRVSVIGAVRNAPRKRWLLILSVLFMIVAYQASSDTSTANRSAVSILIWLLASATALFALWDRESQGAPRPLAEKRRRWEIPAVTLIFAASLALRAVDLDSHPFILSGSEASIGLDVAAIAEGRFQSPFSTAWLTNPALPLYLLAVPITLFGKTTLAVRILSPFIGALTVLVVYLFGRRLWGPWVALISSLLLMGSHMHIHYSRLGLTNIWEPLLITAALGLIYSAWQSRNRSFWLAAGVTTGLNAYLYTPSHIFPLILAGVFLTFLLDWHEFKMQRSNLFAAAALAFIVAMPQLLFYRDNPAIYMERATGLGIIQNGWYLRESDATGKSPSAVLIQAVTGGMASVLIGQDNSVVYSPGTTFFGFWASLLMLVGSIVSLVRWRQLRYAILLIWVGISVLFAGALLESPPQSHRLLIILPAAYLLLTIGLIWLSSSALKAVGLSRRYMEAVVITAALVIIAGDLLFYFGDYRNQYRFGDRNTEIAHELSLYLDDLDGQWAAYFYGAPSMFTSFPTFAYLIAEFGDSVNMVDVFEPSSYPPAPPSSNTAYVLLPEKQAELQRIQEIFPGGKLDILPGHHANPLGYIYSLPAVTPAETSP